MLTELSLTLQHPCPCFLGRVTTDTAFSIRKKVEGEVDKVGGGPAAAAVGEGAGGGTPLPFQFRFFGVSR